MKMKKNLMMMLAACLALSVPLSGCGSTVKDTSSSVSSEVSGEAETSGKSSQELLDEENAIMAKNNDQMQNRSAKLKRRSQHFRRILLRSRPAMRLALHSRSLREKIWTETRWTAVFSQRML